MPSIRWLLLLLAVAALQTACGPIRSTTGMVDARAAIRAAEEVNADSVALYEMTLAREYLDKAREEMGYNDYFVAEQLSIKAMELAIAAREKAVGDEVLLEEEDPTLPTMEEPDLEVLPDVGELPLRRRTGDEEADDDLLAPDPWEEEAAPTSTEPAESDAPLLPASDPWSLDMPPPEPTPSAPVVPPPAEGTPPTEGTSPAEEPPPAEEEEEEEDSGDLLLPDWLDEEGS